MGRDNRRSLGLISPERRVQIGIRNYPRIQWHNANKVTKRKNANSFGRNKYFARKASYRTSGSGCESRFLQHIFSGTQEIRRHETCDQFKTSQCLSKDSAFQDGHNEISAKSSKKRGFCVFSGPSRRLFSSPYFSKSQKVSKILCKRENLPVESYGVWAEGGAPDVHQGSFSCGSTCPETITASSSIFRRLVGSECNTKVSSTGSENIDRSPFEARLHNQFKEIPISTDSENSLFGQSVRSSKGVSFSYRGKSTKDQISSEFNLRSSLLHSSSVSTFTRAVSIMHRADPECTPTYEANSTVSVTFLETKLERVDLQDTVTKSLGSTSNLVVTFSKYHAGQIFSTGYPTDDFANRCQSESMGGLCGQSHCSGSLVCAREKNAYQFFRDGSSLQSANTFSTTVEESGNFDSVRQCLRCPISEQTRRDEVTVPMFANMENLESSSGQSNLFEGSTHCGQVEYIARPVVQDSDSSNRVDIEQNNSQTNFWEMGATSSGSVCISSELSMSNFLLMDSTPGCTSSGCIVNSMGENVCVCFSPIVSDSKSTTVHETVSLQDHSHLPELATEKLVSRTIEPVSSSPSANSSHSRSITSTQDSNLPSQSSSVQTNCMAAIDRHLRTEGFSKRARKLLKCSWRAGTQRDYNAKYNRFCSWCSERKINPFSISIVQCADFLTYLYHEGLQYRTISGYRSMLSAILPPIADKPVGQHPYIIRMLRGIFNERPPQTKLLPEWDLPLVLSMLQKYPFEPIAKTSLKYVTFKTVFLTAITTFRRTGDLQALKIGEGAVSIQAKGVTFLRQGLSKQDRPSHISSKIFLPSFKDNKLLDPKRALYWYLKKTDQFRNDIKGRQNSLFLSYTKPHQKVTKQTLSRWIVKVIQMAYEDSSKKVKAHSTRSLGPSWALFNGASMQSVMEAADWSRETTFIRFYLRNVEPSVLK